MKPRIFSDRSCVAEPPGRQRRRMDQPRLDAQGTWPPRSRHRRPSTAPSPISPTFSRPIAIWPTPSRRPAGSTTPSQSFQTAVTLAPDFAVAHYNFGNCLLEMGRLDEAVSAFLRRRHACSPISIKPWAISGNALKHSGQRFAPIHRCPPQSSRPSPRHPRIPFQSRPASASHGQIEKVGANTNGGCEPAITSPPTASNSTFRNGMVRPAVGRSLFIHSNKASATPFTSPATPSPSRPKDPRPHHPAVPPDCLQIPMDFKLFQLWRTSRWLNPDFAATDDADLHLPLLSLPHGLGRTRLRGDRRRH